MEAIDETVSPEKYPAYKDSGIDWLGEIPAHWELKKLKYEAKVVLGKMLCNIDKGGYSYRPYLKSKNIQWLQVDTSSVDEMWFSPAELKLYRLLKDDLILSEGGEVGKTCIWGDELEECYIQNSAHKVTVNQSNSSRFFLYLFFTFGKVGFFDSIVNRVSIAHLTQDKLVNVGVVLPPLEEQTRIAEFLDRKTAQIDQAITQKERLIDLLNERRQVLIHRAVTRGLDPNAPLKDSGIEWIGEIPAHWKVSKLGNYATINNGTTPSRDNAKYWNNGTVAWLSSGKVNEFIIEQATEFITVKAMRECSLKLFPKGAVLIGIVGQGKTRGTSAILNIPATINQNLAGIISNKELNSNFLHSLLSSFYKEIRSGNGSNQEAMNCQLVASIKIVIPPVKEQLKIFDFIKKIRHKSEVVISLKVKEIQKLQELKATLINSAVTGKIRV